MDGYQHKIPAQRRFEGLTCSAPVDLALAGIPMDSTINLYWEIDGALPLTATWQIEYQGPTGDQPSPILDLPAPTRAFALTGLTNYTVYTVTLNAMLGAAPTLTATTAVMPTDYRLYLPEIEK